MPLGECCRPVPSCLFYQLCSTLLPQACRWCIASGGALRIEPWPVRGETVREGRETVEPSEFVGCRGSGSCRDQVPTRFVFLLSTFTQNEWCRRALEKSTTRCRQPPPYRRFSGPAVLLHTRAGVLAHTHTQVPVPLRWSLGCVPYAV